MPPPGWFAEEGWALTPETAGIAQVDGPRAVDRPDHGVEFDGAPKRFVCWSAGDTWVASTTHRRFLSPPSTALMSLSGESAQGSSSMRSTCRPATLAGEGLATLSLRSTSSQGGSVATAIEQFDLQSTDTLMWGYDEGWHEAEFEPTLGVWRWTSDRATLRVVGGARAVNVTVRVESPERYFDELPTVRMLAGDQVLGATRFEDTLVWSVVVPLAALQQSGGRVTIETTRTFVPAERGGPPDARVLGLRVFAVDVSAQD